MCDEVDADDETDMDDVADDDETDDLRWWCWIPWGARVADCALLPDPAAGWLVGWDGVESNV